MKNKFLTQFLERSLCAINQRRNKILQVVLIFKNMYWGEQLFSSAGLFVLLFESCGPHLDQKSSFKGKKIGSGGLDVARGPYVELSCI
jgi:hypothetical protein